MGYTRNELQEKLNEARENTEFSKNDVNVGYSTDDAIDVPTTSGDLRNSTQHIPHDAQFVDSSVTGVSFTDPVVGFIGGMLGLNSPVRTPTISTGYNRPPIRAEEVDLTPKTLSETFITPTKTVKQMREEYEKKIASNKPDNRKQVQPTPQPQPSPPKPHSPPQPPAKEDESEDESEEEQPLPKGKGKEKVEVWKKYYSEVLGGEPFNVKDIVSIGEIRKKCLELVRAKYSLKTRHTNLFDAKVINSDNPQYIYKQILKVKQIKKNRKEQREKARKDFS
jgi:hypothetical protein